MSVRTQSDFPMKSPIPNPTATPDQHIEKCDVFNLFYVEKKIIFMFMTNDVDRMINNFISSANSKIDLNFFTTASNAIKKLWND